MSVGDGVKLLLTCTDVHPAVVARIFAGEQPWDTVLACKGGVADTGTLQLLDLYQNTLGIDQLVVLQHTGCRAGEGSGRQQHHLNRTAGVRLTTTLLAIESHFDRRDPSWLSGYLYDQTHDQVLAWNSQPTGRTAG